MEHSANIHYPNASPHWCNANIMVSSMTTPAYDGYNFWYWYPRHNYMIWFDTPLSEDVLGNSNVCYRLQGNVWFCPIVPEEQLPPEPVPLPMGNITSNLRPSITITTAKMENHAEHVSVMFGQVISNLK
jgi:hypothetical protein